MRFLNKARDGIARVGGDGDAIEGNAQIVAHGLQACMVLALKPGKRGVAREEVGPAFEGFGYFDAELFGAAP